MTNDPELDEAITHARPLLNGAPDATIVRELAIRGARALAADSVNRLEVLEQLAQWSTDPRSSMDREALRDVRDVAWRRG